MLIGSQHIVQKIKLAMSPVGALPFLFVSLLVLLVFVAWSIVGLQERISRFSTSERDQTNWTVFQLETDFLRVLLAAERHLESLSDNTNDAQQVYDQYAQSFDIFYSRVGVFSVAVNNRIESSAYWARILELTEDLVRWTETFDSLGPDDYAPWRDLYVDMGSHRDFVRSLVIDGLQYIVENDEQKRLYELGLWQSYSNRLLVILSLIGVATVVAGQLTWSLHKRTKKAETRVDDLTEVSRELKVLSVTDPLTGLLTRRALPEIYSSYKGEKLAVFWLDIDDFKSVNDTKGHAVGDELLECIAKALLESVNRKGHVFRLGGEEFGILIPTSDSVHAETMALAFCDVVSSATVETAAEMISRTASIGVVLCDAKICIEKALEAADRAMFEAKVCGKNQFKFGSVE